MVSSTPKAVAAPDAFGDAGGAVERVQGVRIAAEHVHEFGGIRRAQAIGEGVAFRVGCGGGAHGMGGIGAVGAREDAELVEVLIERRHPVGHGDCDHGSVVRGGAGCAVFGFAVRHPQIQGVHARRGRGAGVGDRPCGRVDREVRGHGVPGGDAMRPRFADAELRSRADAGGGASGVAGGVGVAGGGASGGRRWCQRCRRWWCRGCRASCSHIRSCTGCRCGMPSPDGSVSPTPNSVAVPTGVAAPLSTSIV